METKTIDPTKIKFQPTGDRVLIEPDTAAAVTEGGIHIPDTAKERPQIGTIVACGEGRGIDNEILAKLDRILSILDPEFKSKPLITYKEGMRVLYGRYSGSEIDYDGKKVLIMRMSDIAGVIN